MGVLGAAYFICKQFTNFFLKTNSPKCEIKIQHNETEVFLYITLYMHIYLINII